MTPIRALYTDIDGTLVGPMGNLLASSDRKPSLAAAEAVLRAQEAGLEIVGLSGRAQLRMFELGRLLGLRTWICELGGVRVYEGGAEVIVDRAAYEGDEALCDALRPALETLVAAFPNLEEHDPWNEGRVASVMVRGGVEPTEARALLAF